MGYYSHFELSVHSYDKGKTTAQTDNFGKGVSELWDISSAIIRKMIEYNKVNEAFYPIVDTILAEDDEQFYESNEKGCGPFGEYFSIYTEEEAKWYESNEEMIMLSKDFPNVIFKLHVEGEESGDIYDNYYLNGKCATYRAVIPPLNLEDLM